MAVLLWGGIDGSVTLGGIDGSVTLGGIDGSVVMHLHIVQLISNHIV